MGNQIEELEELRRQLAIEKAAQKYRKMGLTPKAAETAALAEVDNDFDTLQTVMSGHFKVIKAQAEAQAAEDLKQQQSVTLTAADRAILAARHSKQDTTIIDHYRGIRKRG